MDMLDYTLKKGEYSPDPEPVYRLFCRVDFFFL